VDLKTIIIDSERQKTFALNLIQEMPIDGTFTVETKKTDMSSTAKQRRLAWLWYTETAASGLGRDDHKDGVHLTAKWQFARPILLRDSEVFGGIYAGFSLMIQEVQEQSRADLWREFTRDYISTEQMTRRQRAEYLREFEMYWRGRGVDLTIPQLQGLDENLGWTQKKESA
jgi:hypothetical protein